MRRILLSLAVVLGMATYSHAQQTPPHGVGTDSARIWQGLHWIWYIPSPGDTVYTPMPVNSTWTSTQTGFNWIWNGVSIWTQTSFSSGIDTLVAGTNITLSPSSGIGSKVTISASATGGTDSAIIPAPPLYKSVSGSQITLGINLLGGNGVRLGAGATYDTITNTGVLAVYGVAPVSVSANASGGDSVKLTTPLTVQYGGTGNTSFPTADTNQPILVGSTGTGALQATAPGTAGQVLTSNGMNAPGWASVPFYNFTSGVYYPTSILNVNNGNPAPSILAAQHVIYYAPFFVNRTSVFTSIGIDVTTNLTGDTLEFGIYNDSGVVQIPTSLQINAGFSVNVSGIDTVVFSPAVTLTNGWHWLAVVSSGAVTETLDAVGYGSSSGASQPALFEGFSVITTRTTQNVYTGYTQSNDSITLPGWAANLTHVTTPQPKLWLCKQ